MTNDDLKRTASPSREEQEYIWLGEILSEIPDIIPTDDEMNEMERMDHSRRHGFGTPYSI